MNSEEKEVNCWELFRLIADIDQKHGRLDRFSLRRFASIVHNFKIEILRDNEDQGYSFLSSVFFLGGEGWGRGDEYSGFRLPLSSPITIL